MSILTNKVKTLKEMPLDEVYVIYGSAGSGKTVLASTFPKTDEAPMLYLDMLEGGTGSISELESDNIQVVQIDSFDEINEILTDVVNGYTVDDNGKKIKVKYSTIVFDTATQLEFLLKKGLMQGSNKENMTLQLWGHAKQNQDTIWNMAKYVHQSTGSRVVVLAHEKEVSDENNSEFNKIIPAMMNSAAHAICAKASFVWYTKIESEPVINPDTQEVTQVTKYITYIDNHPYLLTKCRKPIEFKIPTKVANLNYKKFKKNILDKLSTGKPKSSTNTTTKPKKKVVAKDGE